MLSVSSDGQKPVVNVRFPPSLAAAARYIAEQDDGVTLSAWIRGLVEREIAQRTGRCYACGQQLPRPEG
jgi:hypothetical protein